MKRAAFLERCDPRVKLLVAVEFSCLVAVSFSWRVLLGAAVIVGIWSFLARMRPGEVFRRLLPANVFLFLVLVTLPFGTPGSPLWSWGPLAASKEGLLLGSLIFLKSNLILWASILLLGTSSIFSLAHALHHLKVSGKLVQLVFFTYRYLEFLRREYRLLREAATLRGFVPRTNLHTYRTLAYLMGNLLVRSYDRSQKVFEAMLCRGFDGFFPVYHHFSLKRKDLFFGLLSGAYVFGVAIWGYYIK